MTPSTTLTAGIDTAKDKLDVAVHGRAGGFTVENSAAGWNKLAAQLITEGVARIGIAASVRARPASAAGGAVCGDRSMRRHWRPRSAGTRRWSRSTAA